MSPASTKHKSYGHAIALMVGVALLIGLSAHVINAYVAAPVTVARSGSTNFFVQSAVGESQDSFVTATFRRDPGAGNVLVAVVSSAGDQPPQAVPGWTELIASGEAEPAQAIFYHEVTPEDGETVTWTGLPARQQHVLQVFEYRFIDVSAGGISAATISGNGRSASLVPGHAPTERLLEFTAVTIRDRERVYAISPEGFAIRRSLMTNGSGALSVMSADRLSAFGDSDSHEADLSGAAFWTMQTVALRTARSVDAARLAIESGPNVTVTTTADLTEPIEGDTMTFTVTVSNADDAPVTAPSFLVRIPRYVDLRSASATGGRYQPRSGNWSFDVLEPGAIETLTLETDISPGSARATFFFRAAMESFDGMLEGQVLPWDASRVQVEAHPRLSEEEIVCDDIVVSSATFSADEISSTDTSLSLAATNATYVLTSEELDILSAVAQPYAESVPVTLSEETGEKTLYVWLASPCDQAAVEIITTTYTPAPAIEETTTEVVAEETVVQE